MYTGPAESEAEMLPPEPARRAFKTDVDAVGTERRGFFHSLITMDESLIYQRDPQTKTMSMEWKHVDSPPPKKWQRCKSQQGRSSSQFFVTVMESFSQITFPRDKPSLAHTRAICWTSYKFLWKINALQRHSFPSWQCTSSLSSQVAVDEAKACGFGILQYPTYFLNLAPSEFFFFPEMKNLFRGRRFNNTDDIINEVGEWFQAQSAD